MAGRLHSGNPVRQLLQESLNVGPRKPRNTAIYYLFISHRGLIDLLVTWENMKMDPYLTLYTKIPEELKTKM